MASLIIQSDVEILGVRYINRNMSIRPGTIIPTLFESPFRYNFCNYSNICLVVNINSSIGIRSLNGKKFIFWGKKYAKNKQLTVKCEPQMPNAFLLLPKTKCITYQGTAGHTRIYQLLQSATY